MHCLNVVAIQAKIATRQWKLAIPAHVVSMWNSSIGTLDDRDLAKQLTLLRLTDSDEMEDTLHAYQGMFPAR